MIAAVAPEMEAVEVGPGLIGLSLVIQGRCEIAGEDGMFDLSVDGRSTVS
jgi:hypothetical protein